jgi:hypothetical protein
LGSCDIFIKKVLLPPDKHKKLKINELALYLTGAILISAIVAVVKR